MGKEKKNMIDLSKLTEKDIGRWVLYEDDLGSKDKGRIKSWNIEYIFVVYKCNEQWDRFQEFTAIATHPRHLSFEPKPEPKIKPKRKYTKKHKGGKVRKRKKKEQDWEPVKQFNGFFKEVGGRFISRKKEIEQIKGALVLGEHILLEGKTGTGKSQLARTVFHHITNGNGKNGNGEKARVFEIQFSKFMSEDYVFGAVNINKLKNEGIIEHNIKDSIVDCDFAFIDEFFDGSDVLIRSLLEILNERTFTRNQQKHQCNLRTAILTSNYTRDEEITEAVLDRILFKSNVASLENQAERMKMYKMYLKRDREANSIVPLNKTISLDLINGLNERLFKVILTKEICKRYDDVLKEFTKQTAVRISDRTSNKALNLIRLNALLNRRMKGHLRDIARVKYAVCSGKKKDEEKIFDGVFDKLITSTFSKKERVKEMVEEVPTF